MPATEPTIAEAPRPWIFGLFLAAMTGAVFWPALTYDFVNLDDWFDVTKNVHVRGGLSLSLVGWAFQMVEGDHWFPFNYISHAIDVSLFGLRPWGHHLMNLLIHAANVILLFAVLRRMTRDAWRSAFVAAIFAIHPLQVESVAWVAERKNVLSFGFCLIALWCYAIDAERPNRWARAAVLLSFIAAILSKAVAIVLPCLLLLLDYWPLERFRKGWRPLIQEKIWCFAVAGAAGVAAIHHARIKALSELPLHLRSANALISCARYLGKAVWPSALSVHYPYYLGSLSLKAVLGALFLLVVISLSAVRLRSRQPAALAGWLWFLITLAPMIGLLQVGDRAMADHYAYMPIIGLAIMAAWAVPQGTAGRGLGAAGLAAAVLLPVFMVAAGLQVRFWRNSVVLWEHALSVNSDDPVALRYLGLALYEQGKTGPAIAQYRRALELDPDFAEAHNNLGVALAAQGDLAQAVAQLRRALELSPNYAKAHNNLGMLLAAQGALAGAAAEFSAAAQADPNLAEARENLAQVQARLGGGGGP